MPHDVTPDNRQITRHAAHERGRDRPAAAYAALVEASAELMPHAGDHLVGQLAATATTLNTARLAVDLALARSRPAFLHAIVAALPEAEAS